VVLGEALPLIQWCAIGLIIVASVGSTLTAVRDGRNAGAELVVT
jgi:threonine/homoserine efflux transporter RhtA